MSIVVVEDFLSKEDCQALVDYLDNIHEQSSMNNTAIELDNGYESLIILDCIKRIRNGIEGEFSSDISLVNCDYVLMPEGSSNDLHSDLVQLDGTPYDDGQDLEYSGLIYLNSHGQDFSGGEIEFPNQHIVIAPQAGMAVFFRGDLDHIHQVNTVKSGVRKNLVLFFDKSGRQDNTGRICIHTK